MKVCSQFATGLLAGAALGILLPAAVAGGLQPQGLEFPVTRGIPGDQVNPAIALGRANGWVFWQDAAIDGDGLGIAGTLLLEGGPSGLAPIRINQVGEGDQENVVSQSLPDGSVLCVWQSGVSGFQRIRARVLGANGVPADRELAVSEGDGEHQVDPVVTRLLDGSVAIAWSSYRQDGSVAYDVYARVLAPNGEWSGSEFILNATSGANRRSPALAALPDGGFMAAWIAERQVGNRDNLDARGRAVANAGAPIFAIQAVCRSFSSTGQPTGPENSVSESGFAANPVLSLTPDGNVFAAWTRRNPASPETRFDVFGRLVDASGAGLNTEKQINVQAHGDQYRPRLALTRHGVLAVWTSMGQDGSWEGVFGRWIETSGEPSGDEIPVNSDKGGGQLLPAVASSADQGLVVAWSSNQPRSGHELFAQRLVPLLLNVRAAGNGRLNLRWPTVRGGTYQLQSSTDAKTWRPVGGTRIASGETDELEGAAPGQMVLYRIVRVR